MKKRFALVLVLALALCFAGCGPAKTVTLDFPFEPSEISSLEISRNTAAGAPEEMEGRSLDDPESIRTLYEKFENLQLEEKELEPSEGAMVTSFLFQLADGSSYDLEYSGYGVKKGMLVSEAGGFAYFTKADIGGFWNLIAE